MNGSTETVSDLGERGLLDRISRRLGKGARAGEIGMGDDAAMILLQESGALLTVDVLVEGVDFEPSYSAGYDIGWKAMAVNVSDIAAMGGEPSHAVVALALSPDTPVPRVDELLEGTAEAAERWGVGVVGGDISSASEMSIAVTMAGAPFAEPVLRSGARPGDEIVVTGELGGAAAGLRLLQGGPAGHGVPGLERLAARHLRPVARVEEARLLVEAGVTAMIDVSDGFAVDLWNLLEASGIGCDLDEDEIPIDRDLAEAVASLGDMDPFRTALLGGEDFELLATLPAGSASDAVAEFEAAGVKLTRVGIATDGGCLIRGTSLDAWKEKGWQHLLNR